MKKIHPKVLLSIVFLTGASVLVIEVAAVRILSPYFGNTLFNVSSVLAVVLAALSAGYYIGGRIADKWPTPKMFFRIIFFGGMSVMFLYILQVFLLPKLGFSLSIMWGPLISSLVLFFLPSFFLGMLSPFAIRLQTDAESKKGVGTVTGEIFFWSTIGSIFGSLITGFVLIPNFGISTIIVGVGIFLTLLGSVSILSLFRKRVSFLLLLLIFLSALGATAGIEFLTYRSYVYAKDGVYEKILIFDSERDGQPARYLVQDKNSSAAVFLDSDEIVFDYVKFYEVYRVLFPEPKNVLSLGGGAYTIPQLFFIEQPEARIDVVEIEPELYEIAKRYFRVTDDARIQNHVMDARRFLHDTDKTYDIIHSDVYHNLLSIPAHLTTLEFFQLTKEKLSDDGFIMLNIIGSLADTDPSLLKSEMRTFRSVFPSSVFIAVKNPNSELVQNVMFIGLKDGEAIDLTDPAFLMSDSELLRGLAEAEVRISDEELSQHELLTDDFAPVDYYSTMQYPYWGK